MAKIGCDGGSIGEWLILSGDDNDAKDIDSGTGCNGGSFNKRPTATGNECDDVESTKHRILINMCITVCISCG